MLARRPFLRTFTLATCGLFVPRIVRAVPPPLLDRTLRRKASNDALNVGLVGAWTLATGNGLTDWSGHGNSGTGNGTGFTLGGASDHLGRASHATTFASANNQYVQSLNAPFSTFPVTLAAWTQTNFTLANNDFRFVAAQVVLGNTQAMFLDYVRDDVTYGGNVIRVCTQNNGATNLRAGVSAFTPDGTWNHLVAIWNSATSYSLYVNGVAKTLTYHNVGAGNPGISGMDTGLIGIYHYNTSSLAAPFNGNIADVRWWNLALPVSLVQQLMLVSLSDPDFAHEFWAQNPNHFLRPAWEERVSA